VISFAVRMTDPVRHAPADGGANAMAIRKTLSAAEAGDRHHDGDV
jgi:hypothetical protein